MKKVVIFTDGSCKGNPGVGGYGAILQYVDTKACPERSRRGQRHEKAISGGIAQTTNNRAELTAAIQALSALKEPCQVDLWTDSQYLVSVATVGRARANLDLVGELRALMQTHQVTVHHVQGHNGHPENERADRLAREAAALQAQANRAVAERG
jgi:ribonuclease HI